MLSTVTTTPLLMDLKPWYKPENTRGLHHTIAAVSATSEFQGCRSLRATALETSHMASDPFALSLTGKRAPKRILGFQFEFAASYAIQCLRRFLSYLLLVFWLTYEIRRIADNYN